MTAFASRRGAHGALGWEWEARSVNGRGLELRPRLPDGIEGLEPAVRAALTQRLARGNLSLTLRLDRTAAEGGFTVDETQLDRILSAFDHVQERAFALGVTLAQPTAADVLSQRGVLVTGPTEDGAGEGLLAALLADLGLLVDDLIEARAREGSALGRVIAGQLDAIAALVEEAADAAVERRAAAGAELSAAMARVAAEVPEADPARLAQELALLAVKGDVTEEVDRLRAHIAEARALVDSDTPTGRRLDFLSQEFNREANTLMSKGGSMRLTRAGLDLKVVIDQMREQVQNVE